MRLTAMEIINTVLEHYNLYYKHLVSHSRRTRVQEARQVAIYFIHKWGDETIDEIAIRFNRSVDAIQYIIKKVKKDLDTKKSESLMTNSFEVYYSLFNVRDVRAYDK